MSLHGGASGTSDKVSCSADPQRAELVQTGGPRARSAPRPREEPGPLRRQTVLPTADILWLLQAIQLINSFNSLHQGYCVGKASVVYFRATLFSRELPDTDAMCCCLFKTNNRIPCLTTLFYVSAYNENVSDMNWFTNSG